MEKCKRCGKEINLKVDAYVEIDEVFPQGTKFKLHRICYDWLENKIEDVLLKLENIDSAIGDLGK